MVSVLLAGLDPPSSALKLRLDGLKAMMGAGSGASAGAGVDTPQPMTKLRKKTARNMKSIG